MEYEFVRENNRKIACNFLRRMGNLIKLGQYTEAKELNIRYTGILTLWEIQAANMEARAAKDGSAAQRIK
jgi:hypothetical protein